MALSQSKEGNFRLTYDTYPNGVAKLVIDKYRFKKDEYEIEFSKMEKSRMSEFIGIVGREEE